MDSCPHSRGASHGSPRVGTNEFIACLVLRTVVPTRCSHAVVWLFRSAPFTFYLLMCRPLVRTKSAKVNSQGKWSGCLRFGRGEGHLRASGERRRRLSGVAGAAAYSTSDAQPGRLPSEPCGRTHPTGVRNNASSFAACKCSSTRFFACWNSWAYYSGHSSRSGGCE